MFNPAGAVIQAIIATYNTIAFFIERIKQILAFVESVVDSILNIAQGKISAAANYVERAMARTIPVILGFLARLIGLGNVSDAVKKVITAIQEKVDKALDSVIKWIVDKAKSLVGAGNAEDGKKDAVALPDGEMKKNFSMKAEGHTVTVRIKGGQGQVLMASSVEQALADLANAALDDVNDKKRTPTLTDEERRRLRVHLLDVRDSAQWKDIKSAHVLAGMPQPFDPWLNQYVTDTIQKKLLAFADEFGLPSLQAFVKNVPALRFLPLDFRNGDFIRDNLYVKPADWKAIKERDDPGERKLIGDAVDRANATKDIAAWNRLQIAPPPDGRPGYRIPAKAEIYKYTSKDVATQAMSRDHVIPLAQHWQTQGYNLTDAERKPIGEGTGGGQTLELITVEYNSRKGALGANYRFDVLGNFASDLADSPAMSWKIKGHPFTRDPAGTLVTEPQKGP